MKIIFIIIILIGIAAFFTVNTHSQNIEEMHVVEYCKGKCKGGCGVGGGDEMKCWSNDCFCGCKIEWLNDDKVVADKFSYIAKCPG